jgi:hypothetical protein
MRPRTLLCLGIEVLKLHPTCLLSGYVSELTEQLGSCGNLCKA